MTDFTFHADPGHAWLEVARFELDAVGLSPADFSRYSYQSDRNHMIPALARIYYLEEDCDAPKFLTAWEKHNNRRAEIGDKWTDNDSEIRWFPAINQTR